MPCNLCPWRPYKNFCHAHGVFSYLLHRLPFRVFNLAGFFYHNFLLDFPLRVFNLAGFIYLFYFLMLYLQSLSMLIGQSIFFPSKFVILVTPPDMIFLIIKCPGHLGFIFPLGSKVSSLSTFRTKSSSLRFLGFTFLLNALAILFWYPCAWYCALALFSSIKFNYSYLSFIQSSFRTLVSTSTLKDCISTSIGMTASHP